MKNSIPKLLQLLFIFPSLCSATAQAALRCEGNLSQSETRICSDKSLKRFDEILNEEYASALKVVQDKSLLKHEQIKWLKFRDHCNDNECQNFAYVKRINELQYQQARSLALLESGLTEQEAKTVCSELTNIADENHLNNYSAPGKFSLGANEGSPDADWSINETETRKLQASDSGSTNPHIIYRLLLKPNAKPVRFAGTYGGGTCSSEEVFNLDHHLSSKNGDSGVDTVNDPEEEIRWAYWGGGDYPIMYRGRYFMITSDLADANRVHMISWIKPDGRVRPLCLLKVQSTQKVALSSNNKELCSSISNGRIRPLSWKAVTNVLPFNHDSAVYRNEFSKRFGNYADDVKLLHIDLNGDGEPENIGYFEYASGAGCGSTNTWLAVLSKDLGGKISSPLNSILEKLDSPVDIYKYQGKYYIENVNGLVQVQDNQIVPICEFGKRYKSTISRFFGVAGQPLDSARDFDTEDNQSPFLPHSQESKLTPLPKGVPKDLASKAEIDVVAGYEAEKQISVSSANLNSLKKGSVTVKLNRPGKNILLVLDGFRPIDWKVDISSGTHLKGILFASHDDSYKSTVSTNIPAKIYGVSLPYTYDLNSSNFLDLLKQLNQWFNISHIDSFSGGYSLPENIEVTPHIPLDPSLTLDGLPPQKVKVNFDFNLYTQGYVPVKWTLRGTKSTQGEDYILKGKFTISSDEKTIYRLLKDELIAIDKGSGVQSHIALPSDFPPFSWATDLAHDSHRDIVAITSFGGEGYLYRYDIKKRQWIDYHSAKDIDVSSLAYDPVADRYVGWTSEGELLFISSAGEIQKKVKIAHILHGFGRLDDGSSSQSPRVLLAPHGNDIALVGFVGKKIMNIWYYNIQANEAVLTYSAKGL